MMCWLLELTEPTLQPGTALATVSAWLPRSSTHRMHFRCWPSSHRLHWPQPSLCCCWRDQQRSRLLSKDFWYSYRGISRSRYYRSRGITVRQIPYPRYYRKILPITTVITAVTAVLPRSPLPCHSLITTSAVCLSVTVRLSLIYAVGIEMPLRQ